MASELQRLAEDLLVSVDQLPVKARLLQSRAVRLWEQADYVDQLTQPWNLPPEIAVRVNPGKARDALVSAAKACEAAALEAMAVHARGSQWAHDLANGVSSHTEPTDTTTIAAPPVSTAKPGAQQPASDQGDSDGVEVLELSSLGSARREALNNPPANSTILVDGRFTYETDELGRVIRASAQLDAVDRTHPRDATAQRTMEGKLPGDHAGHIFARLFQGPGGRINLTAMTGNTINQSKYKIIENEWAAAIKNGHTVDVEVSMIYRGSSQRATGFEVRWVTNGERHMRPIRNTPRSQ